MRHISKVESNGKQKHGQTVYVITDQPKQVNQSENTQEELVMQLAYNVLEIIKLDALKRQHMLTPDGKDMKIADCDDMLSGLESQNEKLTEILSEIDKKGKHDRV